MLRQAVILAGGLGSRLGDRTRSTPKPLLPVGGVPFLEHVLWNLRRHGIREIVLSTGYLAEKFVESLGDGSRWGMKIDHVVEPEPAGTGGALLLCHDRLQDRFLFLNGDTLFDINYLDLDCTAVEAGALACLALRQVENAGRYGAVTLEGNLVTSFSEKTAAGRDGLINGGISVLKRTVLDWIPRSPCSLEQDVIPQLVAAGKVAGRAYDGFFIDIGLPETLDDAQSSVPCWRRKSALLLDRDGVINVNHGYVHRDDQLEWIAGAPQAIKAANDAGYLVVVTTNQAGIARGYYDEEHFQAFMAYMNERLAEYGAHLDAWYFCPHHPTEGVGALRVACECRKPNPGMVQRAIADWNLDSARCVLVGDSASDVEAAEAAQVHGLLFDSEHARLDEFVLREAFPRLPRSVQRH